MTTAREDSGNPPPAAVLRMLKAMGFKEVELPSRSSWWVRPGYMPGPWEESVDGLCAELVRLRAVDAVGGVKRFFKTSEFWVALATLLGLLGGSLAVLTSWGMSLAEPWRELVGGAMAIAAVSIPRAYTYARARAKAISESEKASVIAAGGEQ